jgi:hypothetical protein
MRLKIISASPLATESISPFAGLCPVSLQPFQSPMIITTCGHTLDHSSLQKLKEVRQSDDLTCPCCRTPFSASKNIVKNYQLEALLTELTIILRELKLPSQMEPDKYPQSLSELFVKAEHFLDSNPSPTSPEFAEILSQVKTAETLSPNVLPIKRLLIRFYKEQGLNYMVLDTAWRGAQFSVASRVFFLNQIGNVFFGMTQHTQAIPYFKLSIDNANLIDPNEPTQKSWLENSFQTICTIFNKLNDRPNLQTYLSKYLDYFPGNQWALTALQAIKN